MPWGQTNKQRRANRAKTPKRPPSEPTVIRPGDDVVVVFPHETNHELGYSIVLGTMHHVLHTEGEGRYVYLEDSPRTRFLGTRFVRLVRSE